MFLIIKKFLVWLGVQVETGEMTLVVTGPKEVQVTLPFTPRDVWLNLRPTCCMPVCQGDVDSFDLRIVPNGFVVIVRLTSEFREVEWVATK